MGEHSAGQEVGWRSWLGWGQPGRPPPYLGQWLWRRQDRLLQGLPELPVFGALAKVLFKGGGEMGGMPVAKLRRNFLNG